MPEVRGKSVVVLASDNHAVSVNDQRHNLRESLLRRRHPQNICHAKYLELLCRADPPYTQNTQTAWGPHALKYDLNLV